MGGTIPLQALATAMWIFLKALPGIPNQTSFCEWHGAWPMRRGHQPQRSAITGHSSEKFSDLHFLSRFTCQDGGWAASALLTWQSKFAATPVYPAPSCSIAGQCGGAWAGGRVSRAPCVCPCGWRPIAVGKVPSVISLKKSLIICGSIISLY